MLAYLFIVTSLLGCSAQQLSLQLLPFINASCPSAAVETDIQDQVRSLLRDIVIPSLRTCGCGGPGWTRIAYLNMSDPSQQCPPNWNLTSTPVRGCSGSSLQHSSCDSAIFPSTGSSYSRVCGRMNAFQKGSTDAFDASVRGVLGTMPNPGLEDAYVDGVSLTHGAAGSRQHIWTFAAALFESDPHISILQFFVCSCTTTNITWPYQVPSFVGNNYFCDNGNPGPGWVFSTVYADDLLWDGQGCGPTNACCEFNNPPWFCTTLPQPTTDDIELRICRDEPVSNEDSIITFIDIYVQ